MHIIITRRPIGEAPEWVRDAWIGMTLPALHAEQRRWRGVGVLSGPNNPFLLCWAVLRGRTIPVSGYAVDPELAVSLLAEKNPSAAQWWRENTPKLIASGRAFIFDTEACEVRSI